MIDAPAWGGRWVSELLVPALERLERAWLEARVDPAFRTELNQLLRTWAGRPTPLWHSPALSQAVGCRVYLKREDLLHGGAHKTNNTLGQALLAKRIGASQLIAETGAGQHGVATAMAGALVGLPVRVYMGAKDVERQAPNVARMRLLGAEVIAVRQGAATLKDAINEAMRAWTADPLGIFYVFGTAAGPDPYPRLVQDFQRVIGDEAKEQLQALDIAKPTAAIACVGGGSNAIGLFTAFLDQPDVRLIAVEAAGRGLKSGAHGATLTLGTRGVVHGMATLVLQTADGQIEEAHSVSAGLDYPGVGPLHAALYDAGRLEVQTATDAEAVETVGWLARAEGIIPALESAHALAALRRMSGSFAPDDVLLVCLSGRGDKDLAQIQAFSPTPQVGDAPPSKPAARAQLGAQPVTPRLTDALAARKAAGQGAFVPFLMLGDPDAKTTLAAAVALAAAGADALEVGLPFSDPPADGPLLQASATRALAGGMNTACALELLQEIATATRLPLSLLCYANPVLQYGLEAFHTDAARAGVQAVLVADVALEHRPPFVAAARAAGIHPVALASLISTLERLAALCADASGFIYVAGQMGTTGERAQFDDRLTDGLATLRRLTTLPLIVGFGLSSPEAVRAACAAGADGAIVGSAIVRRLHEAVTATTAGAQPDLTSLTAFASACAAAAR